ncbi:xanthine dehydrogenase accessory protein XdhC [Salinicola endophyticus]|uniref:xanthine dehydrogenase accessory protein XdhC n=1 Tax=Salinicola endophyticus TaxID=1949083 RepID=UPI000DA2062C|nr:xanthine dehydrogenase accessory protein XdhC [Salinicola endophyticus]
MSPAPENPAATWPPEPWHAALHQLQQAGEPHVLASIVAASGSTPREPGAKLVITAAQAFDTLGGGHFEQQVIALARETLAAAPATPQTRLETFVLGARSGQCCGGCVQVLIESFPGTEQRLSLFGAGHVGQALVALLAPLPWRIDWFDSRTAAFDGSAGGPRVHCHGFDAEAPEATLKALVGHGHVLIMTHDHALDRRLLAALAPRDDLASLGLIGSASKWSSFRAALGRAGLGESALERVRCPIGLAATAAKRPQEIAISVAAELLALSTPPALADDDHHRGIPAATLRDAFPSAR